MSKSSSRMPCCPPCHPPFRTVSTLIYGPVVWAAGHHDLEASLLRAKRFLRVDMSRSWALGRVPSEGRNGFEHQSCIALGPSLYQTVLRRIPDYPASSGIETWRLTTLLLKHSGKKWLKPECTVRFPQATGRPPYHRAPFPTRRHAVSSNTLVPPAEPWLILVRGSLCIMLQNTRYSCERTLTCQLKGGRNRAHLSFSSRSPDA